MPRPSFNPVDFFALKPKDRYAARVYRLWESLDYYETHDDYLEKVKRLKIVLTPLYTDLPDNKELRIAKPVTYGFLEWYTKYRAAIKGSLNTFVVGNLLEEQLTNIMNEAGLIGGEEQEAEAIVTDGEITPETNIEPTEDEI